MTAPTDPSSLATPRENVRSVRFQGGYVAKQCPVRAQHENDTTLTVGATPVSPVQRARMDAGLAFEAAMFERLVAAGLRVLRIPEGPARERGVLTRDAVADGFEIVLDAQLPLDPRMRRVGRPDVLVRVGERAGRGAPWRYVPVDVKHHSLTRAGEVPLRTSPLGTPDPLAGATEPAAFVRRNLHDDAFQLAHYWRMLEHAGWAPDASVTPPIGGIIDRREQIWWIDLADPRERRWWADGPVSILTAYDHEYAFRLDVIARTLVRNAEPGRPRAVEPVRITECRMCPWEQVCDDELRADDHVSLLPGSTWERFVVLRRHGVLTRAAAADLDWRAARLVRGAAAGDDVLDVGPVLATAAAAPADALITGLVDGPVELLRRCADLDLERAADLAALDSRTLALAADRIGRLPKLIDDARAATAGAPLRGRDSDRVPVPRGLVEVDVDMESTHTGTYLWGAFTTATDTGRIAVPRAGYHPFVDWAEPDPARETALIAGLWSHLAECRRLAEAAGGALRVYCYSDAEARELRRIVDAAPPGSGVPTRAELEVFLASAEWVDLYDLVRRIIVAPNGYSLKRTARWSGFDWRDDDAGGAQSMEWHFAAATAGEDEQTKLHRRLLEYNEDDVRATLALRRWLDGPARSLPSVADWPLD